MTVSVCIPAFKRYDVLQVAIHSVFANSIRPLEIVVSDDAHDPQLRALLADITCPDGVILVYTPNERGRGQASNILNAYHAARFERLVLMHDDDFFLDGGIDAMAAAWDAQEDQVDAVFGRLCLVDEHGRFLPKRTADHCRRYHRDEPGYVPSNLWSALVQQFPPNGMMLRRSLALAVGVPSESEVGRIPIDTHFAINYALASSRPFLLIDADVSAYRLSQNSILRTRRALPLDGHLSYTQLEKITPRSELESEALRRRKQATVGRAILGFIADGQVEKGYELFHTHFRHMKGTLRLKAKILFVVLGARFGITWPHWLLAQRRWWWQS